MSQSQEKPAEVEAAKGKVIEHKPDGSAVSMKPIDAVETAQKLLDAAAEAKGQELISRGKDQTLSD